MDLIDRQDAIEAFCEQCTLKGKDICPDPCTELRTIYNLPSAERKTGRWEIEWLPSTNGGHYQVFRCTECHNAFNWQMNFCGECGAYMKGEEYGN